MTDEYVYRITNYETGLWYGKRTAGSSSPWKKKEGRTFTKAQLAQILGGMDKKDREKIYIVRYRLEYSGVCSAEYWL